MLNLCYTEVSAKYVYLVVSRWSTLQLVFMKQKRCRLCVSNQNKYGQIWFDTCKIWVNEIIHKSRFCVRGLPMISMWIHSFAFLWIVVVATNQTVRMWNNSENRNKNILNINKELYNAKINFNHWQFEETNKVLAHWLTYISSLF